MLARVSHDLDKRPSSPVYNAVAPAAAEIAQVYADLDTILNLTFARSSSGEFLRYRTEESGVKPNPATPAIRKGIFNVDVPIGSRFRGGEVVYKAIEKMAPGEFKLEAETPGTIGNEYFGELLPIEYINGLTSAVLADVLVPGENEETDGQLYERYLEEINATRYGGNVDQYREWIRSIPGVGRFKIQPLWNGRGTVRAILTDANNQVPSSELVALVQNTLDPYQDGTGFGLVPIGHIFTAAAAIGRAVNVGISVVFKEGYGPADIQADVEALIDSYFSEINFLDPQNATVVRHAILLSRLVGLSPVQDILSLTLNGGDGNLTLADEEVAVRGTVNIVAH
jgi:uncharacterized phage protein gp47/JayE